MEEKLRIGIDVDDVLNNFFPHWVEEYNKKFNKNMDYLKVDDYDLRKVFKKDDEWNEFISVLDEPDFYEGLKPDKLAQVVIKELLEAGAEILLITGTYPNQVPKKFEWIKRHFPEILDKNILFVPAEQKINVLVNVYIEDNPRNRLLSLGYSDCVKQELQHKIRILFC